MLKHDLPDRVWPKRVVAVCRRLDGMPLAIELASARVRLLGVDGVRQRPGERFSMLTAGARAVLRRHQTLRAALEWSLGLLTAPEQLVLRRLAVFVGGLTLEAAQEAATDKRSSGCLWGQFSRLSDCCSTAA